MSSEQIDPSKWYVLIWYKDHPDKHLTRRAYRWLRPFDTEHRARIGIMRQLSHFALEKTPFKIVCAQVWEPEDQGGKRTLVSEVNEWERAEILKQIPPEDRR